MPDRKVEQPIPGREAFKKTGAAAAQSQAALLLLLGRQIRGDDRALVARAAATAREDFVEPVPDDDLRQFEVPRLRPTGERFGLRLVSTHLAERFGSDLAETRVGAGEARSLRQPLGELADRLYEDPDPAIAAQLMEASLRHPEELTRVAAAASYFEISTQPKRLIKILADGTRSPDDLVRSVAAVALARVAPDHARLRQLMKARPTATDRKPSHTSLLVHGTFAKSHDWWQPGGDFHEYILSKVRHDLYGAADRFDWSGGYSDAARSLAATELRDWAVARGLAGLDVFGHSHGANIALLASQSGLTMGTLVLLSCPVHIHKYSPNPSAITRVVSLHVHLDLVVLADRGGQRFNHPNIEEHVLDVWFDHQATHDRKVWKKHSVKTMLGL
jgi:predicted esterase